MIKLFRATLRTALCVALVVASGCGSASSNDQGVSFTFLGFFSDSSGTTGLSGVRTPISSTNEGTANGVDAFLGFQNNILGQGVRAQRIYISYYIPGASTQPPDTSVPLSVLLGPAGEGDSTLPAGFLTVKPVSFNQAPVVPAPILEWLNLNRSQLPELPFAMEVIVYASAISTAGDSMTSNTQSLYVELTPDVTFDGTPPAGEDTPAAEEEEA